MSAPLPLAFDQRRWLIGKGVAEQDIDHPWPLRTVRGIFLPAGRFDITDIGDSDAIAIEIRDRLGSIIGIAVWCPATGKLGTVFDEAAAVGEGLFETLPPDHPIRVHRTVLGWLKSGRIGGVILHHARFRALVGDRPITAEDERHAAELRRGLAYFPTVIAPTLAPSADELNALYRQPTGPTHITAGKCHDAA